MHTRKDSEGLLGTSAPHHEYPRPKLLLKSTFAYSLGSLGQKGLNVLLLPIYTRTLAAAGYGSLNILTALGALVNTLLGMGLPSALTVKYGELKENDEEVKAENTILTVLLIACISFLIITWVTLPFFASRIIQTEGAELLVGLYLLSAIFGLAISFFYTFLRLRFQFLKHLLLSKVQFLLSVFLVLLFVIVFNLKVLGVVLAMLTSSTLMVIYFLVASKATLEFHPGIFKKLFKFGIWLVPMNAANFLQQFSDRFFILAFFSLSEVGVYAVAGKLAHLMNVFLTTPFRHSFGPYVHQSPKELSFNLNLGSKFLMIVGGAFFFVISLSSETVIRVLMTPEFLPAAKIVPILLVRELLGGLTQVFGVGIHKAGKSYLASIVFGLGAAINLLLNFLLIPKYSIFGAAIAACSSSFVIAILYLYFSSRETTINFDKVFMLRFVSISTVLYFGGRLAVGLAGNVLVKLLIVALILVCYLSFAFLSLARGEKGMLKNLLLSYPRLRPLRTT